MFNPSRHHEEITGRQGSNPFEMSCAIEVFGARRRPQLGFEPYRAWIASPVRSVPMRDNLFSLGGGEDIASLDRADTIVVPNRPDVESACRPSAGCSRRELSAAGETVHEHVSGILISLTAQERHITRLVREGNTNSEIGAQLFISPRTVEWHLGHIFAKLGVKSRRELRSSAFELT